MTRLMDNDKSAHEVLVQSHWQASRPQSDQSFHCLHTKSMKPDKDRYQILDRPLAPTVN